MLFKTERMQVENQWWILVASGDFAR